MLEGAARFNVLMCGRRFGKTTLGMMIAVRALLKGEPVGWFAPTYKTTSDVWRDLSRVLKPITTSTNKMEARIVLATGGILDVWSVDNPDSGRGRKYGTIVVDEAGVVKDLENIWQGTLRPTLADYQGAAWFLGTPKGRNYFQKLFTLGQGGRPDWKSWRLPSTDNPYIPAAEIEAARSDMSVEMFRQEFEGYPADDGGCPFNLKHIEECVGPLSSAEPAVWGVDLAKSHDWTVACGLDDEGRVCRLERWQAPWRETEARLIDLIGETYAAVDSTGVGDPVVEVLQASCPFVEGFKFTRLSKQQLMEGLSVAIHTNTIAFPDGWLRAELEAFEYTITPTGVRYEAPSGLHDDGVCALALALHAKSQHARHQFTFKVI